MNSAALILLLSLTVYPNGAVHDYIPDLSLHHFRFEPFQFNPLVIVYSTRADMCPVINRRWIAGYDIQNRVWVLTRDYWIPYPQQWQVCDAGVLTVVADYAIDANLDGVPDYFQWDYTGDGHIDLPDLSYFGDEYNVVYDLSDFSAFGSLYCDRYDRDGDGLVGLNDLRGG